MPRCRDCEELIVFIQDSVDRWIPSVPVLDFAELGGFILGEDQRMRPLPQVYIRHQCAVTPAERFAREKEREDEKQSLIAEDRARRRQAAAAAAAREAEEARIQAEHQAFIEEQTRIQNERKFIKDLAQRRKLLTSTVGERRYYPSRLLEVTCPKCEAEVGAPCVNLAPGADKQAFTYYCHAAHNERYQVAPAAPLPPQTPRWGEDYQGPWPPPRDDPGRYEMVAWLSRNFTIFDSDEYRERDWLTRAETHQVQRWLHRNADIFNLEETHAGPEGSADDDDVSSVRG